jgi:hypothetical protein
VRWGLQEGCWAGIWCAPSSICYCLVSSSYMVERSDDGCDDRLRDIAHMIIEGERETSSTWPWTMTPIGSSCGSLWSAATCVSCLPYHASGNPRHNYSSPTARRSGGSYVDAQRRGLVLCDSYLRKLFMSLFYYVNYDFYFINVSPLVDRNISISMWFANKWFARKLSHHKQGLSFIWTPRSSSKASIILLQLQHQPRLCI